MFILENILSNNKIKRNSVVVRTIVSWTVRLGSNPSFANKWKYNYK